MDLAFNFQTISAILALLIVYTVFRSITSNNGPKEIKGSSKYNKVPEPCGALPFIGHLHLLNANEPYFRTFSAMAEKYGSIFSLRLGCHNTLVVSNREIAKECLITNDKAFASRPNIAAGRYMGYNNAILGLAPYGKYWRDMRKIATLEILSSHRLEKLKHVRDREIFSLVKDLYNSLSLAKNMSNSIEVPISNFLEHMTFNYIVQMIAGKRFSAETIRQGDSEAWRLRRAIKDFTYLSGVFVMADAIPYLSWFDFQGHVSFMKRTFKEIDLILDKWMNEHVRKRVEDGNGGCENDFMDVLISTFEEHDVFCGHKREIVIKATALFLILTASGSTAITLTWALSLLLNHPSVLKAAQQELDNKIGKDKWVQECDIKDLNYLQAIIKETLRLYPAAPLTGIREAIDDCNVAGYHVPKGTRLFVNLWKLQRDPKIWSNPDEFQPERFLTTHVDLDFQSQNFEFIPFSFGRRSCPGMTFGLQVVHLTLARLLQGFDIYTKSGVPVDMKEGLGVAMPKENTLKVILQPRLPMELYESL
ncbi:dimethylnonatriene synthase-like [Gastrolobium bilobum]|uniref:dimethylnonatriene synthase-like n=1 Tax=Gastrolobium bilobum TaxID=150636 RepID=UPI002AB08E45|nr:dimethylnonatriene synthase-like [Gastrolobium bilobum]